MEELQKVEVLLLVKSSDRDDVVGAESGVTLPDDLLEVGFGDLVARDVERENLKGKVLEGEIAPFGLPVGWQGRDLFWDEQAAVVGKTLQNDILEGKLGGFSA